VARLISLDVGGTLGATTGPLLSARLAAVAGAGRGAAVDAVMAEARITAIVDDATVAGWCEQLGIDVEVFPWDGLAVGFEVFAAAPGAVASLAAVATTVTLSNSLAGHAHHHAAVTAACPGLTALYTSYGLGLAKPDPAVFRQVASWHGAAMNELVHVGDSWTDDVLGVLAAGGRAVWIAAGRPVPDPALARARAVLVVDDIAEAATQVAAQAAGPP
jgi:FMN phosphatase YigB (HAD superfamily)